MDLKPVDLSDQAVVENVSIDASVEFVNPVAHEIDILKRRNHELQDDIEELRKKKEVVIKHIETQVIETKTGLDEETIQKLSNLENRLLEAELELETKNKAFNKEVEKYEHTIQNLTIKLDEYREKEPCYLTKIENLTHEKVSLVAKIEEMKKEREALIFERDNLLRGVQDLKAQLADVRAKFNKTLAELTQANATIVTLKENFNIRLTVLEKEREALIFERNHLSMGVQNLNEEVAQLRVNYTNAIADLTQARSVVLSYEAEMKEIKDLLSFKLDENRALLLRMTDLEIIKMEFEGMKTKWDGLVAERDGLAKSLSLKDYENHGLKCEVNKYLTEVKIKKDEIGHITKTEEVLVDNVRKLQQELEKRDRLIEDIVFRNNTTQATDLKLVKNIESLKCERDGLLTELQAVKTEKMRLLAELDRVIPERERLLALISQKDGQINALTGEIARLLQQTNDLLATVALLEKKRDAILIVLGEREGEILRLREALEKALPEVALLKKQLRALEEENANLNSFNAIQAQEIDALKKQIAQVARLQNRVEELEKGNVELRVQLEPFERTKQELALLQIQIGTLFAEKENLIAIVKQKDAELAQYKALLADYEAVKKRDEFLEKENMTLGALIKEKDIELSKLRPIVPEFEALKSRVVVLDKDQQILVDLTNKKDFELNLLRADFESAKLHIITLQESNSILAPLVGEKDVEISKLKTLIDNLELVRLTAVTLEEENRVLLDKQAENEALIKILDGKIVNLEFKLEEETALAEKNIHLVAQRAEEDHNRKLKLDQRIEQLEAMNSNLIESIKQKKEVFEHGKELETEVKTYEKTIEVMGISYAELEAKYHALEAKHSKMESVFAQLKGATELMGDVHEKLVETCEETEKADPTLKVSGSLSEKQLIEKILKQDSSKTVTFN